MDGVCLSVRHLSCVSTLTQERKGLGSPKLAHHTGNQWTYLEIKRSKIKVTKCKSTADSCCYWLCTRIYPEGGRCSMAVPVWLFLYTPSYRQVGSIAIFLKLACLPLPTMFRGMCDYQCLTVHGISQKVNSWKIKWEGQNLIKWLNFVIELKKGCIKAT